MHLLFQFIDDNGTGGNGQGISSRFGHFLGKVYQHIITRVNHLGLIGRTRHGVDQRGFTAWHNLGHTFREGDGEILQA